MIDKFQSLVLRSWKQVEISGIENRFPRFKGVFRWALAASVGLSALLVSLQPLNLRISLPIQEIHIAWNLTRILIEF